MLKVLKRTSLLLLFVVVLFSCSEKKMPALPILGERDLEYSVVDGREVADTIYQKVPSFKYLIQDSVMITSESMKDKVWVADFFFSHCPTICPTMTAQMKRLNFEMQDLAEDVQFMSFSIDPDRDTPKRLREYRDIYDIEGVSNWNFFTGDEERTHVLAKSFFNGAERDDLADGGFGHTDYFAIVDTEGYVRGIYQGTNTEQVDLLQVHLRSLLNIK